MRRSAYTKPSQILGTPIPPEETEYAISVELPFLQNNIDYEVGVQDVIDAMGGRGYPRFVIHFKIVELCKALSLMLDINDNEFVLPFSSPKIAKECVDYAGQGRVVFGEQGIGIVVMDKKFFGKAKKFWQHTGGGISARQAHNILNNIPEMARGNVFRSEIKRKLARLSSPFNLAVQSNHVFLYKSGASAVYAAFQAASQIRPDCETLMIGDGYIDSKLVQDELGSKKRVNARFDDLQGLRDFCNTRKFAAALTEVTINPTCDMPDIAAISEILKEFAIPFFVDNTFVTSFNFHSFPHADVELASLSKYYSGGGNVLAGSLILNPGSEHFVDFDRVLRRSHEEETFYTDDAYTLFENSKDFEFRMARTNKNGWEIAHFLRDHPAVKNVFYTGFNSAVYDRLCRKRNYPYGGMIHFELKDESKAEVAYNNMEVYKGPGFGNRKAMACVYYVLAEYPNLEEIRKQGRSPYGFRLSTGDEKASIIKQKLRSGLDLAI